MNREDMLKTQAVPSRPATFYRLNRGALVEECAKVLAKISADPDSVWLGSFMAPMTKGERTQTRQRAKEIKAENIRRSQLQLEAAKRKLALTYIPETE